MLQAIAVAILPAERVSWCARVIRPNKSGVEVWRSVKYGKAHYYGLAFCGGVWVCPVCAEKVTQKRRGELKQARELFEGMGGKVIMVTVTMRHSRRDRLTERNEELNKAWRGLKSGRWWQEFAGRHGVIGDITGLEVTWGDANGWHSHKHAMLFVTEKDVNLSVLKDELYFRWSAELAKVGADCDYAHGVDVSDRAKEYVSKWGIESELALSPAKKSRSGLTPFQLLELAGRGDAQAKVLFWEYASAMKGRHQLEWSRGLRKYLGLAREKTDRELVDEREDPAVFMVRFDRSEWKRVLQLDLRGELLKVASEGDPDYLSAWLIRNGIVRGSPGGEMLASSQVGL